MVIILSDFRCNSFQAVLFTNISVCLYIVEFRPNSRDVYCFVAFWKTSHQHSQFLKVVDQEGFICQFLAIFQYFSLAHCNWFGLYFPHFFLEIQPASIFFWHPSMVSPSQHGIPEFDRIPFYKTVPGKLNCSPQVSQNWFTVKIQFSTLSVCLNLGKRPGSNRRYFLYFCKSALFLYGTKAFAGPINSQGSCQVLYQLIAILLYPSFVFLQASLSWLLFGFPGSFHCFLSQRLLLTLLLLVMFALDPAVPPNVFAAVLAVCALSVFQICYLPFFFLTVNQEHDCLRSFEFIGAWMMVEIRI